MHFWTECSDGLLFVKLLWLCCIFFLCVLPWQGASPVWEKADGLHGWQPAELVGSTSDTPSCHSDVISKPVLCRRSSLRLTVTAQHEKNKKVGLRPRLVTALGFWCLFLLFPECVTVFNVDKDPVQSPPAEDHATLLSDTVSQLRRAPLSVLLCALSLSGLAQGYWVDNWIPGIFLFTPVMQRTGDKKPAATRRHPMAPAELSR